MLRIRTFLIIGLLVLVFGCSGGGRVPSNNLDGPDSSQIKAQLDTLETPLGVDPDLFETLKEELQRQLAQLGKTASAPPLNSGSAAETSYDAGSTTVSWYFWNTGDYDQNGEVNVSDLTPIALHFGQSGPFMDDSVESVIDGDGNGEINLADITPIVLHYLRTVDSYSVYSSDSEDEIPTSPDGPIGAGARSLGNVDLANAIGNPATERLRFEFNVAAPVPDEFYWVRPIHGSDEGIPTPRIFVTDMLGPGGGDILLHDVVIFAPEEVILGDLEITHRTVPVPATLPTDFFQDTGEAHEFTLSDPELLDAPLEITLPYDDRWLDDEDNMAVLHFDSEGNPEPVTMLAVDTVANTVTFDSRDFSQFAVVALKALNLANNVLSLESYTISDGWSSGVDGWDIANFGSYFSPGGNCLGMSGYSVWWYKNMPTDILYGKYSTEGGAPDSIAHITATRAHLAQSQYWGIKQWGYQQTLGASSTGILMKAFLKAFDQPLILVLGTGASPAHASVVYGWDATGFKFYEVNQVDSDKHVDWSSAGGWGNYGTYNNFSFVGLPSLGRGEDFAQLVAEAAAGYTSSQDITLTSPTEGEEIAAHDTQLTGTLGGGLNSLATIITYIKGVPQTIPVSGGAFNSTIPVANGENTIIIIAGTMSQSRWYRNGATLIRNITGTLPPADFIATLSWDQGSSDVDLYVTEPGGETAWYSDLSTSNGLVLDFDNTSGYGPEHITLTSGDGDTVLAGDYVVRVHYYADHGGGPVTGRVSIVANEGKPNFVLRTIPFSISVADSSTDGPGGSGPQWRDITTVQLVETP